MNTIQWSKKAVKQLVKLPAKDSRAIYARAGDLKDFPDCKNVKKLNNHEFPYRLRVGNYRVFFSFDGGIRVVSIEEVKKRDERTY